MLSVVADRGSFPFSAASLFNMSDSRYFCSRNWILCSLLASLSFSFITSVVCFRAGAMSGCAGVVSGRAGVVSGRAGAMPGRVRVISGLVGAISGRAGVSFAP